MEFEITKEQIEEIARTGTHYTERYLQSIFPEAFDEKLETGKWVWIKTNGYLIDALIFIKEKSEVETYGFNHSREYTTKYCNEEIWRNPEDVVRKATKEEIESALIAEAKKRGYKKGVTVLPLFSDGSPYRNLNQSGLETIFDDDFTFDSNQNSLDFNKSSVRIFCKGKWAEILPTEKTVITVEKALKILAKKLKVSPENIEIE